MRSRSLGYSDDSMTRAPPSVTARDGTEGGEFIVHTQGGATNSPEEVQSAFHEEARSLCLNYGGSYEVLETYRDPRRLDTYFALPEGYSSILTDRDRYESSAIEFDALIECRS